MSAGITESKPDETHPVSGLESHLDASFRLTGACEKDAPPEPPAGFELLEEVGRGGMGVIYRARDLAFNREIALKFLQAKYGKDSPNAIRFLDEACITGQLQHPGIPAVHQVGTLPNGRHYLVMKLIKGYTLSDLIWKKEPAGQAAEAAIPHVIPQNYLGIFEAICQAVGYAHAHHVIHRDLKPHNIMVGAFGEVQVMDWGLAKLIHPDQLSRALDTEKQDPMATLPVTPKSLVNTPSSQLTVAGSVLGTPAYMSPEQAVGANSQLDTRSDVFGLGAILCALLTGKPPFVGDSVESTRLLSALGLLDDSFERLDASGAEPELIALAKRCLAAKRSDRPHDGGEVAQEVAKLRAAADERARQAEIERTKAEVHAQEQRHRRKVVMISSTALIVVLFIGIIGTTWGLIRAAAKEEEAVQSALQEHAAKLAETDQRNRAEAKEKETQAVVDFVANRVIAAARPEGWEQGLGRNVMLREALLSSLKNITSDFKDQPLMEARVRRTLGSSFWFLGDYPIAVDQHERALKLYIKHAGEHDREALQTLQALANLDDDTDRLQEALEKREKEFHLARDHYGINDHLTQMAMANLAISYQRLGRHQEAFKLREEVLPLAKKLKGTSDAFTLHCISNLAQSYSDTGKLQESLKLFEEALALQKKHLGPTHPNTVATMSLYANTFDRLGRHGEALPLHQKALELHQEKLGQIHPKTLDSMTQLAFCYTFLGRNGDALQVNQKALPLFEKQFGVDHEKTLTCLWCNVTNLFDLNRSGEAVPLIDSYLKRSAGKRINAGRQNAMHTLRFKHYKLQHDLPNCQATLADWDKANLPTLDDLVDRAAAWAVIASFKREADKTTGQAEADQAMERLQKVFAAGWDKVKAIESSEDFASLRHRDDYRLLLAKMKQMAAEKKPAVK